MIHNARIAGFSLALVAMLLRALLPDGWMPSTSSDGAPLMACPGADMMNMPGMDMPMPKQPAAPSQHHPDICPFASAMHVAAFAPQIALSFPSEISFAPLLHIRTVAIRTAQRREPQSPRAPPVFA